MANSTLSVEISADVTQLQAKSAIAQAELRITQAEIRKLAASAVDASAEMKASITAQLEALQVTSNRAKAEMASLKAEIAEGRVVSEESAGALALIAERAESLTAPLRNVQAAFSKIGEVMIAAFAVERVADFIREESELGAQTLHVAQQLGVTTEQVSGLKAAAEASGETLEGVTSMMDRLGRAMEEATKTGSPAAAAFESLGISSATLAEHQGNLYGILGLVADKFKESADGPSKIAIAMDLLGKSGAAMIPILDTGADGLKHYEDVAVRTGTSLSGLVAEGMERTAQRSAELSEATSGLGTTLYEKFKPAIDAGIDGLTHLVEDFDAAVKGTGPLAAGFEAVDIALRATVGTLETATVGIEEFSIVAGGAIDVVAKDFNTYGLVAVDALSLNWQKIKADYAAGMASVSAEIESASADLARVGANYQRTMTMLVDGDSDDKVAKPLPALPNPVSFQGKRNAKDQGDDGKDDAVVSAAPDSSAAIASSQQLADQQARAAQQAAEAQKRTASESLDTQLAIDRTKLESSRSLLDGEVTLGDISGQEKIQAEIKLANEIYQLEQSTLTQKAALYTGDVAEHQRAMDEIAKSQAQHNAEMLKLDQDLRIQKRQDALQATQDQAAAALKTQQAWIAATKPISQAFSTSITGIIQGTNTLRQAEAKAAQSIALSFIQAKEQELMQALSIDAMKLASVVKTELGIVATKAAATEQGKAVDAAAGSAEIVNNASKAAAGAYAAVVGIQYVGPILAPIAAATAYAGVMAYDVLSAEGGLERVPFDGMPAVLHENETVMPASVADPMRDFFSGDTGQAGASAGGDTHHYHINYSPNVSGALSRSELESTLRSHGSVLHRYVTNAQRNAVR